MKLGVPTLHNQKRKKYCYYNTHVTILPFTNAPLFLAEDDAYKHDIACDQILIFLCMHLMYLCFRNETKILFKLTKAKYRPIYISVVV